jgi:Spy/CpxP family protein refolding chaperone
MSTNKLRILLPAAAALALALPARAQFEGVIESKMTMSGGEKGHAGSATGTTYVSKSGARMEMTMETPMGSMKMTTLHRNDKPGVVYMINDARKSYSEMDLSKTQETASTEKYTVKKLADEKVAGYDCQHALVTNDKGEESEVWVTKEIGGAAAFWAGQDRRGKSGLGKALKDAGLDGWPMRMKSHPRGNDGSVTWEVVKVEKKSVPSAMLEVPAGYTKSEGGPMGMAGGMQLSPEQQKKMDEAMKARDEALSKMTPEQRQQYEEMMKAMGSQKK